jgi:hypothetical protein
MCNNSTDKPVKVHCKGNNWEFMTLEQLYVKCVKADPKPKLEHKQVDTFLENVMVVLQEDCHDHLKKLMGDEALVKYANDCITAGLSPFEARMKAYTENEAKADRKLCYWPDCPS